MTVHSFQAEVISRGTRMLRTALGPAIAAWLEDPSVVEVMLNPDGRLWIDRLSSGLVETQERLSPAEGERIVRLVAHHVGAEVHPRSPRVSAELPETGERFEGLLPPVVAAPSFAIRKPAVAVFTLEEYAAAGIMTVGQAAVQTSCSNIGQGLWTSLAQITADALGVGVGKVRVTGQDSDGPRGLGTWGSRNITITGNAIIRACAVARERLAVVAAHLLQSVPSEIAFEDDHAFVRSDRGRSVALARLVQVSEKDRGSLPPDVECAPIEVVASYDSPTEVPTSDGHGNTSMTYSAAAHACYLEVDPGTGMVTILDYLMAEDSGVAINPLIVEGQQQGATAMALSQVLFEELAYDADGQPLNANMRDYYTPLSTDLPNLSRVYDCGVPSATTLLGQRGAGESGNVPPLAAVANAIAQATGIRFTELPITPDKILLALRRRGADAFGLQGTLP